MSECSAEAQPDGILQARIDAWVWGQSFMTVTPASDAPENTATKWVVHIVGPDDVIEADDMLDAIKKAHAINEAAVGPGGYYDTDKMRPYMTYGWAIPKRGNDA